MECYLDNSATTRVFDDVAEIVTDAMLNTYGNPSSMHHYGKEAEDMVRKAAGQIARTLHSTDKEILLHQAVQNLTIQQLSVLLLPRARK
jgi:cysteine desulfurase